MNAERSKEAAKRYSWYREISRPELPSGYKEWPRITVVTPSYNQGSYIEETIVSVLSQEYPNLEYFIVDGGSTDETVSVIKKYASGADWWVSEKDNGQTDAINKGFRRATGEYINWINSDDILYPGSLYHVALAFMQQPDTGFVYGRTEKFNDRGSLGLMQHTDDDLPLRYYYGFPYGQQGCFYSRKLVEEVGYLNEGLNFSMDYDLFLRLNMRTRPFRIDHVIGGFRDHEASKTNNLEAVMVSENLGIFRQLLESLDYREGFETLKRCGAPELILHGYGRGRFMIEKDKAPEITAKFLERYLFYYFDARNFTYVFHAYRFINRYMPELIRSKPVYRSMFRKAALLRFIPKN